MRCLLATLAALTLLSPATHAQWGGFSTASGRGVEAYGMGNMAAGRGQRNLDNSQARATNVNTNMQLNEYMYESLQNMNKAQMAAQKQENEDYTQALNRTQDRLRNHPSPEDVYKGDALNIALTELSDPRYYAHVAAEASQMKIPGNVIKILPFNSASAAVTFGLKQITHAKPAADSPLSGPQFADIVAEYQKLGAELDKQATEGGQVDDDTLQKFEAVIQKAADRLQGMKGVPDPVKAKVEMRLKTLLGMAAMLDSPSLDVYLAELKGNEQVGLDRLLAFMRSFNLRFGIATTPGQKQAYDSIYPMLVELRDKMFGNGTGTLPSDVPEPQPDDQRPMKYFGQMQMAAQAPGGRPAPAPPAPGGR